MCLCRLIVWHEDPHGFKSNYVRGVGFNSNNVKSTERVDKLRLNPRQF